MKISILFLLFLLALFSSSYAGSNKEDYELQERCGKRAEEFFHRNYGDGTLTQDYKTEEGEIKTEAFQITTYTNNYNGRLNKCFILIESKYLSGIIREELYDVNKNENYGTFNGTWDGKKQRVTVALCVMLGHQCKSYAEWNSLIKPYMEE